jgi:hypothetical protein
MTRGRKYTVNFLLGIPEKLKIYIKNNCQAFSWTFRAGADLFTKILSFNISIFMNVSKFKQDANTLQVEVEGAQLTEYREIANPLLSTHFQSLRRNSCPWTIPSTNQFTAVLSLTSNSDSDARNAIKSLLSSKYVRIDAVPNFVAKVCYQILSYFPRFI